ncbi:MAG: FMN-binding protein, partial [Candidatus Latescibacteria bacterium]|nr:FMN-binding protein [Candidatus Latescibacterota bacterium]
EETPGLGGRIADKEFLDLFKEKSIVPMLKILAPGKANAVNEVDGITGATLSCNALAEILNSQLGKYIPLVREGE